MTCVKVNEICKLPVVDGVEYARLTKVSFGPEKPWVFDHAFFLLLNVAVGGRWPGYPDQTTRFPQQMKVDYMRVYQQIDDA